LKQLFIFAFCGFGVMLIFLVSYWINDPFKVLKKYNDYSYPFVIPNRDVISTEMFVKNYPKYHYNSFIFGSSRTLAYRPSSWARKLDESDKVFMFDASAESIYGIYTKLKFLDSRNINIKNSLIILCRDVSFLNKANHQGHLFIKDPLTSGESEFDFQATFFKAYLNPKFFFSYYVYLNTKKYKPFMAGYIENRKIRFDPVNNAITILDQEDEITNQTKRYYEVRNKLFYKRGEEQIDSVVEINKEFDYMLSEIKRILVKHKTNYKIVLSPLYEQIKFNPKDLKKLQNLFGENVYDFSGKNTFTDKVTNYYEISHYRPIVGDTILNIIYK